MSDKNFTERPILFIGPLVRAILEGRKTQTRRPITGLDATAIVNRFRHIGTEVKTGRSCWQACDRAGKAVYAFKRPPFQTSIFHIPAIGDRLWVRETWKFLGTDMNRFGRTHRTQDGVIRYQADGQRRTIERPFQDIEKYMIGHTKWRPSIHMPRWASRIDLEVTGVRVERVQDITEDDARAEGSQRFDERFPGMPEQRLTTGELGFESPHRAGFSVAWDEHYSGSWMRNDWVWVVEFRRAEQ